MNNSACEQGLVSVIIPVYNTELYLRECLESVLVQDHRKVEVIAVNDGSTDSSAEILQKYADTYPNIQLIHQTNLGHCCARNAGIEKARGEYIYFLDSDDLLIPQAFSLCLKSMHEHSADMVFFDTELLFDGVQYNDEEFDYWQRSNSLKNSTFTGPGFFKANIDTDGYMNVMVSTYLAKNETVGNLRFVPGMIHEDNVFTPQILLNANRVVAIEKQLFRHRIRPESIMTSVIGKANLDGYLLSSEILVPEIRNPAISGTARALSAHIQRMLKNAVFTGYIAFGNKIPKHYLYRMRQVMNQIPISQRMWKLSLILYLPIIAFTYIESRRKAFERQ